MLIKDVLQKTTQFFKDKGFDSPRLDTELLISNALGWERMKLYLNYEYPLSEAELGVCRELVRRRATGEPVAYILGRKGFFNHSFKVSPEVLIPRPETETLVEQALEWAKREAPAPLIVDLGTGSGCIGLSLLAAIPSARLLAVDVSPGAVAIAKENAAQLGLENRASIVALDASKVGMETPLQIWGAKADMVLANPPYIAEDDPHVEAHVKKFEPHRALFAGNDGYELISAWAAVAGQLARAGAFVMFEIGHEQGARAKEIFLSTQLYRNVEIVLDLSGRERFIRCLRREEN